MATPIDPNARFERQKILAKQESNAEAQQAKEAVARRFAAMGRNNSGAAIKNEMQVDRASNDALQRRMQTIQDSQDTEGLRRQEIEEGRRFQTSEREATQNFGADQARLGREFMTSERLGGQDFASQQADIQRRYGTSEREASQLFSRGEREAGQDFASKEAATSRAWQQWENYQNRSLQQNLSDRQLGQQASQFDRQFAEDKRVTDFNLEMARAEANKKDIFQRLGDLGTNYWKSLSGQKRMSQDDNNKVAAITTLFG